ncbi:hypothetical protein OH77DRAFT_1543269, partial [Trametes cingulata]
PHSPNRYTAYRIAATPPFTGLRRFPEGHRFKQWTGDDSKALLKVFLPAVAGYIPSKMLWALTAFLDFCYLVRSPTITAEELQHLEDALQRFHTERTVFEELGVRLDGFSLPRQDALKHYRLLIQLFGAPNGLCSSITESTHIKAVKEPWRCSNRYNALGQMLLINQRLDKLAAARADFAARGMLEGPLVASDDEWDQLHGVFGHPPQPPSPPLASQQLHDSNDEDEAVVEGPPTHNFVVMAKHKVPGMPKDMVELAYLSNWPDFAQLLQHLGGMRCLGPHIGVLWSAAMHQSVMHLMKTLEINPFP